MPLRKRKEVQAVLSRRVGKGRKCGEVSPPYPPGRKAPERVLLLGQTEACTKDATTYRTNWRWGFVEHDEDQIVNLRCYYCDECAKAVDSLQAEGEVEAAGS